MLRFCYSNIYQGYHSESLKFGNNLNVRQQGIHYGISHDALGHRHQNVTCVTQLAAEICKGLLLKVHVSILFPFHWSELSRDLTYLQGSLRNWVPVWMAVCLVKIFIQYGEHECQETPGSLCFCLPPCTIFSPYLFLFTRSAQIKKCLTWHKSMNGGRLIDNIPGR